MSAYIPILSAERSRLAGLAAATDTVKDRLTPLFDVPALAATPAAAAPAPTADARGAPPSVAPLEPRLAGVVDALAAAFGRRRAYLDGDAVDHRRADDGRLAAAWLFDEARAWGLPLVPVTGLRRSDGYQLAAAEAASVDRRGVCLRLQLPDFGDLEALPERVHALVDALGVAPDRVDLLVDLGRVAAEESRVLAVAARAVLGPLRRAARWRTLALAAGGATPRLAAGAAANGAGVDRVPRTEWLLWRALTADTPALGFADYAGLGGDGASAAAPAAPAATAGGPLPADHEAATNDGCGEWLGYARDAEWLVVRAADLADLPSDSCAGAPPPLAGLAARPEFYGVTHCAGDAGLVAVRGADIRARPDDSAAARRAALAAWRAAAVTHHLTVTVEGIARAARADR